MKVTAITGMVRHIDELGRIVIPKEIRKTYNINTGDGLEIFINDGDIVLRKVDKGMTLDRAKELLKQSVTGKVVFMTPEEMEELGIGGKQ